MLYMPISLVQYLLQGEYSILPFFILATAFPPANPVFPNAFFTNYML